MSYESGPWVGDSGFEYVFHVFNIGESVPSRQGLYIYCKRHEGIWYPIYMGHGDLSVCCADADLLASIGSKGATHVHMRLCSAMEDRVAELADLLKRYRNSHVPEGCNVPKLEAAKATVAAG